MLAVSVVRGLQAVVLEIVVVCMRAAASLRVVGAVIGVVDEDPVDEGDGPADGKMTQFEGCLEHFYGY
jgi:hypothetical protein